MENTAAKTCSQIKSVIHSKCVLVKNIVLSLARGLHPPDRRRGETLWCWQDSTLTSPQASSMASVRFTFVYGCLSYTFHRHAEKHSVIPTAECSLCNYSCLKFIWNDDLLVQHLDLELFLCLFPFLHPCNTPVPPVHCDPACIQSV